MSFILDKHIEVEVREDGESKSLYISGDWDGDWVKDPHLWKDVALRYIGILTCVLLGLLLAVILPITGFFVFCCRCCGKCGAQREGFEKEGDKCRRVCCSTMLTTFTILSL